MTAKSHRSRRPRSRSVAAVLAFMEAVVPISVSLLAFMAAMMAFVVTQSAVVVITLAFSVRMLATVHADKADFDIQNARIGRSSREKADFSESVGTR